MQEIRYINRDENTHLWLFRSILLELNRRSRSFSRRSKAIYRDMISEGCEQEIAWGHYVIGDDVPGLTGEMVTDYVQYLGNLRARGLDLTPSTKGTSGAGNHEVGEPVQQRQHDQDGLL